MDDLHRRCERREKVILELVGKLHPDKEQLTFELKNQGQIGSTTATTNGHDGASVAGHKNGAFNGSVK